MMTEQGGVVVGVWPEGVPVDLRDKGLIVEMRPIEFHIKMDGAKSPTGDGTSIPSLCIVMDHPPTQLCVYGQISFTMLEPLFEKFNAIRKEKKDGQS